jgi:acyl-CoA-binding protein
LHQPPASLYGHGMSAEFDAALARVKELTTDPGNEAKLKMYGLYKQATEGDVSGKRPGFTNPVGRAKYDAWAEVKGMSKEAAEAAYVEFVNTL